MASAITIVPSTNGTGTSLADFPVQILEALMKAMDTTTLKNVSLTNKFFNTFISERVGFNLFIGRNRPAPYTNELRRSGPVKSLGKVGIRSCTIGNTKQTRRLPRFKNPGLLNAIIFHGRITISKLQTLLTLDSTLNLNTITFSQFSLMHLKMKNDNVLLHFPKLTTFIISGQPSNLSGSKVWIGPKRPYQNMVRNVQHLLCKANAPNVKEFVLQSIQISSTIAEDLIVKSVWKFCVKHKLTLEKISFGILSQFRGKQLSSRPLSGRLDVPRLKAEIFGLVLKSFFLKNNRSTTQPSARNAQLFHLMLNCDTPPQPPQPLQLLQDQQQLIHLVWFVSGKHENLGDYLSSIIGKNCNTLTSIELTIPADYPDISCEIFQNCAALEILTLVRKYDVKLPNADAAAGDGEEGQEGQHQQPITLIPVGQGIAENQTKITNLQLLPTGLTSFRIEGIKIRVAEAEFTTFPHLRKLELQDIGAKKGTSNDFGLSRQSFFRVLNAKQIELIYIQRGFNQASFHDANEFVRFAYMTANETDVGILLKLTDGNTYVSQIMYFDHGVNYPLYTFNDDRSNFFKNQAIRFPELADYWFKELRYESHHTFSSPLSQQVQQAEEDEQHQFQVGLLQNNGNGDQPGGMDEDDSTDDDDDDNDDESETQSEDEDVEALAEDMDNLVLDADAEEEDGGVLLY